MYLGGLKNGKRSIFVQITDWTFKPSAFDDIWHAVFEIAKKLGYIENVHDAAYFWTETYLLNEAWDMYPKEEADKDDDGDDNSWISASLGNARLYALSYGYSAFAWNAFIDGLGLGMRRRILSACVSGHVLSFWGWVNA